MAAAVVASQTDLVASLPRRFASVAAGFLPLRVVAWPVRPAPKVPFALVWHDHTDADPANRAFRSIIRDALSSLHARG